MDLLPSFGVNSELSREEFVRKLRCGNLAEQVRSLRQLLFKDALGNLRKSPSNHQLMNFGLDSASKGRVSQVLCQTAGTFWFYSIIMYILSIRLVMLHFWYIRATCCVCFCLALSMSV